MTFRLPAAAAVLTVLGLAAENAAVAQPIAPPRRPLFTSYPSIYSPGGGYYGYGGGGPYGGLFGGGGFGYGAPGFGFGGNGFGFGGGLLQPQNLLMQQQALSNTANIAALQTYLATGVNPAYGITGRGAVFNNLGHWYAGLGAGGYGGGYGGLGAGGLSAGGFGGRTAGSGLPLAAGGGGAGAPRTAGNGIPIGGPRR